MSKKVLIVGALDRDFYDPHMVERSGSLREENVERRIFRCVSPRSGSGVGAVAPKSEAFRAILAASSVVIL